MDSKGRGRVGDWSQTFRGVQFWPLDPSPDEILIEDVAHSLAMQCRFGGHCREHYSVAEHSVRVAEWVASELGLPSVKHFANFATFTDDRHIVLWALLHDASEAYCVDVPRPLKRNLAGYAKIERRIELAICERFGLHLEMPAIVKRGDEVLLMTEKRDLMGPPPAPWSVAQGAPVKPLDEVIVPWGPDEAERRFLERFRALEAAKYVL